MLVAVVTTFVAAIVAPGFRCSKMTFGMNATIAHNCEAVSINHGMRVSTVVRVAGGRL